MSIRIAGLIVWLTFAAMAVMCISFEPRQQEISIEKGR